MLNSYYLQKLLQIIKDLESLKQHALLNGTWKNAGFKLLSKLIQEKLDKVLIDEDQRNNMGLTVHHRTLTDIFRGRQEYGESLDPRALNTLNILSIFAGYQNWDHFRSEIDKHAQEDLNNKPTEEIIEMVLRKAIAVEFALYKKLPELDVNQLDGAFIQDASASKNINHDLSVAKEKNWTLAYPIYNPSSAELLEHSIIEITNTTAKVATQEKWLLAWWHQQEEKYIHRYDKTIQQTYLFEKINHIWKIKARSNSNVDTSFKVPIDLGIQPKIRQPIDASIKAQIETRIRLAMTTELQGYFSLPNYVPTALHAIFINKGTAYKEIIHNLQIAKKRNWTISNEDNPSANELMDCTILKKDNTTVQVNTKEYWLLYWWHSIDKTYAHIHKEISYHTYLLEKIEHQWYVRTNASGTNSLRIPL